MKRLRYALACLVFGAVLSCSDDSTTTTPDTTPPAPISDLAIQSTIEGFLLSWTAPGYLIQDVQYDIRYAGDLVAQWDSAVQVPSPAIRVPGGKTQSVSVDNVAIGTWQFGLRVGDAVPNWSELSNLVSGTVYPDTIPPARITDLSVELIVDAVPLRWTASGDDSLSGQASTYDLRYAPETITDATWSQATRAEGLPVPRPSGEMEVFTVTGLEILVPYSFGLRVADEQGNWSELSNVVSAVVPLAGPVQLTFSPYVKSSPSWSPDGQRIAFQMSEWQPVPNETSRPQIYVIRADGGAIGRYTSNMVGVRDPSWSPNGRWFTFSNLHSEGPLDVGALAKMQSEPETVIEELAYHNPKSVQSPKWSPDGTRIAYIASEGYPGVPYSADLYVIAAGGGEPARLSGGAWRMGGLDWSPDGTQIVYASAQSGNIDLWLISPDGGEPISLTTDPASETGPAWSPDGTEIAYYWNGQIWTISPAGGEPRQYTFSTVLHPFQVDWSPDGTRILYTGRKDQSINLWVQQVK